MSDPINVFVKKDGNVEVKTTEKKWHDMEKSLRSFKSDIKISHQPPQTPIQDFKKNISNGVWFMLHTMGEAAQEQYLMEAYALFFENLCDKMGCSCENHCVEMLKEHPPKKYFNMVDEEDLDEKGNPRPIGCLYHSWLCHHLVNVRLDKPVRPKWEQVKLMYRGNPQPCKAKTEDMESSSRASSSGRSSSRSSARSSSNRISRFSRKTNNSTRESSPERIPLGELAYKFPDLVINKQSNRSRKNNRK